ncbi:MAG TPA: bifunctional aspartate kinase/homoserine dehydrogenase I [bacterium]|nr:bifunctional aspartate kinase/homoserine dehydrogenase I [bacterium]
MLMFFICADIFTSETIRELLTIRVKDMTDQCIIVSDATVASHEPWSLLPEPVLEVEAFLHRTEDGSVDISASRARCSNLGTAQSGQADMHAIVRGDFNDAVALAACLDSELEVWIDSSGIFPCDPGIVSGMREIAGLSFEEAAELSRSGSSGLDARLVGPIVRYRVPAMVVPARDSEKARTGHGTRIQSITDASGGPVKAITASAPVSMVSVTGTCLPGSVGTAARVFSAVSGAGIGIRLISQASSEYSICFCVDQDDKSTSIAAIERAFSPEIADNVLDHVSAIDDLAILTALGDGMRQTKGIAGKCFTQLARADVNIVAIAQGSSERSISAVIARTQIERGVRRIYQAFFESMLPIDLVLIGCGTVGSALLGQLAMQTAWMSGHGVDLNLVAVTNSRRMIIDQNGLDPATWREQLEQSMEPFSIDALTALGPGLSNPVLVDCTASDTIPGHYPGFMTAGFNVVTPNKRGNTGSMERYLTLKHISLRHRRRYLYETTVAAGLPVVENLQNLLHAGDRLDSFTGILSGSLSFLLGRLDEGAAFSEAVREAMARGFTEPDPRDDLAGIDVARKVLILAREAGLAMELSDIEIDGLVPQQYMAMSKDEFLERLPELDSEWIDRVSSAARAGKVLRFVGSIESGKGRAGLRSVGPEHPLFTVKGGENALAFNTRYYSPVPFLLRGYGAGAQVTAAGIVADIMRTLNWNRED